VPRLSLVLPAYNEASRLALTLQQLVVYGQQLPYSWELLLVDDGSTDTTVSIAEGFESELPLRIVRLPANCGKGWAVRAGMLVAIGEICAFLDADLATPPTEINKLIAAIEAGADVAIGSRIQTNGVDLRLTGKKPQPLPRRVLGKLFRLMATRPFLGNIRDSQCGAKAFTANAAQKLFPDQHIHRWSFDIELLFLAKKFKLKVVEVPVQWEAQEDSKLKPSVSLAIDTLRELAIIAWTHR
jgi:dolichyl-phosphate beta-glucosyltransferase